MDKITTRSQTNKGSGWGGMSPSTLTFVSLTSMVKIDGKKGIVFETLLGYWRLFYHVEYNFDFEF